MNLSSYNKLIAGIVGNLVGVIIVWLAFKFPSIASCSVMGDPDTCTVIGFTYIQAQAAVMMIVNGIFIERWAANSS